MLRKRYIIETINNMLKNMAQIVHSRHRSVNDFIMNLIYALGAYVATRRCVKMHTFCFLRTKPRLSQAGALLLPKDFVSLGIRISL